MFPRWNSILPSRRLLKYSAWLCVSSFVIYRLAFNMPVLSSRLPPYSGEYDVGTIDLEVPCPRRTIDPAVLKADGKPAFELESVLFSLYYPAVKGATSRLPQHQWVPRPLAEQAEGYARFAKINNFVMNKIFHLSLWTLVGKTRIPAAVDVPLHGSASNYKGEDPKLSPELSPNSDGLPEFPIIIFSHGMASIRTSYSHYCGELASRGFVVAAIEHRDGSCPTTTKMTKNGSSTFFHVDPKSFKTEPEHEEFKRMQLAMRHAELDETTRVLHLLNDGYGQDVFRDNPRAEGTWLAGWKGRLNFDRMVVGGHSFGATLALQALKNTPSEAHPFAGAIVLDPGKQSGPLNADITVPILVVHSQTWSKKHTIFHGRPHFVTVKDLVQRVIDEQGKCAWFTTARGTTHPSVTDAPLIEPFLLAWTTGSTIDAREGVLQYVQISESFLQYLNNGQKTGILGEPVTHPEFDVDSRDEERKAKMGKDIEKYWQIHVAPNT